MEENFLITTPLDLDQIKNRAFDHEHDELLGLVEIAKFALEHSLLRLPLEARLEPAPPNPDALISGDEALIGVEVTRVTWQRMSQVMKAARPGDKVELTPELCVDLPARRDRKASKGARSGDYLVIKEPGQKLDGAGWLGDEPEEKMFEALRTAIENKNKKFDSYNKKTNRVWLFLIDDGLSFSREEIFEERTFKIKIQKICSSSKFERIFLFGFTSGISEIYATELA